MGTSPNQVITRKNIISGYRTHHSANLYTIIYMQPKDKPTSFQVKIRHADKKAPDFRK